MNPIYLTVAALVGSIPLGALAAWGWPKLYEGNNAETTISNWPFGHAS